MGTTIDADIWKPGYFEANHLSYMPLDIHLKGSSIVVDYLRKQELKTAFDIIERAADNEYNVGIDEFDWETFIDFTSDVSEAFTVRFKGREDIVALLLIHPSIYSRTMAPVVGYFEIFLTPAIYLSNKDAYKELANLAVRLTDDLGLKYVSVMTQVFCTCTEMLLDLRALNFQLVGCLPRCGRAKSGKHIDSYLLFKDLVECVSPEKVRPFEEIAEYAERVTKTSRDYFPPEEDSDPLKVMPFLPVKYNFKRAGIRSIWRNIRKQDADPVYKLLHEAALEGNGYSLEEIPTFRFFYYWFFREQYGMIVEEEGTGKIIAYNGFHGYWPYRTRDPDVLEGSVILAPEFRGKGMSQEIGFLSDHMYAELGYKGMLSDSAIINTPMHESQERLGYRRVGISPRSVHLNNKGYIDSVYSYKSLANMIPFSQKIKEMPNDIISKL